MAHVAVLLFRKRATSLRALTAAHARAEKRRAAGFARKNRRDFMTGQVGASDLTRLGQWTLLVCAIASLTSCATMSRHQFAEPTGDWQARGGQLLYRGPKTTLIGDVFVRFSKNGELETQISPKSKVRSCAGAGLVQSNKRRHNCAPGSLCATSSFTRSSDD
jgi:hypothetical protein